MAGIDAVQQPDAAAGAAPDLDLRPAGSGCHELARWVQCCPHCGYCATEIVQPLDGEARSASTALAELVRSAGYQRTLADRRYPVLASRFRCLALLQAADRQPEARDLAAMSLLYAAWVCDDYATEGSTNTDLHPAQAATLSRQLRRQAAGLMRAALDAGRKLIDDEAANWLVLADVYRRAEIFPSAHTAAVRGLARAEDPVLTALLRFEQQLVEAQETRAVGMAEAFAG